MARPYFSRLATAARQATMAPPRSITTLWKAAWFDRMSGTAVEPGRHSGSLMDGSPTGEISRRSISVELEPARQGAVNEGAKLEAGTPPRPIAKSRKERSAPPSSALHQPGDVPHRQEQRRLEVVRESSRRIDVRSQTRFVPRSDDIFGREARAFVRRDPEHRRTVAVRERSVPPPETAPPVRTERSLHIGKIEVQVAPTQPLRQTLSVKPRSRLARDYTLGTSWQFQ